MMMNEHKTNWLLIASLILNLFLIGAIAGGSYKLLWSNQASQTGKPGQSTLRFAADNLSNEQQHLFKKTLRKARREAKPLLEASKQARVEVLNQISEPNFDRVEILAALARTREADSAVRIHIEESLLNFAQTLSADDRQKLADGLASRGPLRTLSILKD